MRQNALIGRQVAGRFTIKRFLGEGGMATVFVAEQGVEPREVALKIMNEELNSDRSFVKRFQREAKAASRVQHPNSVQIIDYGVADQISYIAMELLVGDDLYVLLEHEGCIAQGRATRILVEVCDALMVAHELGIVHRDLKPENIMVIPDASHPNGERVKVLDFGIAKLLAPDLAEARPEIDPGSGVTRAGTFIGTPAYMSPEQCGLLPVDTRADIYTCGVLLYQLVTGRLPFEGQTPLHTATLHIHEVAPKPSSLAPRLDPRLEAIILKALAKKPNDRHQTARHLASTLRKILPDLPDVAVGKVGQRPPGSLRSSTRERPPRTDPVPAARPSNTAEMGSAQTMVAPPAAGAPPDQARAVPRPAAGAPPQDPRPPAIVRFPPPAPSPAAPAKGDNAPDSDDDDNDFARTLVRAPVSEIEEPPRFPPPQGPLHTEVIAPPSAMELPVPPAPPPPFVPREAKQTLKSAAEFRPSGPEAVPVSIQVIENPVSLVTGPASAPFSAPEPSGVQAAVTPAAFAQTAKVSNAEMAAMGAAMDAANAGMMGTAQTVPMISHSLVASVIAAGPPRGVPPAPMAPGPVGPTAMSPMAPPYGAPMPPQGMTVPVLPQTPPVFPMPQAPLADPQGEGLSRISGARGLLIGFFAGAVIMALFALVYVIFGR
jgi:serine/threonine-protein kinase